MATRATEYLGDGSEFAYVFKDAWRMSIATQDHRVFELKTPLGKDVLLLQKMSGTEAMSQPFLWDLDLLSEKADIDAADILGQKVCVSLTLPQGQKRFFHGFVSEFSQGGWVQRYYSYRAIVRPWYWLLTRTADCRIFQELTVPQIFQKVVQQYGFTDYEQRLTGNYQVREYCVQYRETDFNFLSRLLEQEGIYFFFEHAETKHTLVLADDPGEHKTCPGYETVPYYPPAGKDMLRERDHLQSWTCTSSVRPGAFATTDFDFEKPRNSLAGSATVTRQYQQSNFEVFDYPGQLSPLESQQSDVVAKIRIQELQASYTVASGQGNAAGLGAGVRFTLEKFPRKDLNIAYIITQASYTITTDSYETGQPQTQEFSVAIEAIDARTQFRPERRTPKAVIHGTQTAIVVGRAGDEIYTDQYGRVKVQFHWDRYGKQDDQSSCWVRVSQPWAGKNWGAIHIPRIGQEVIVSFLEGDPDRPIITGRVYNGDSMPPYSLPGNATQSGIKTRSSKAGSDANFNEIRFEDLKGSEQLYIHAEKNQDIVVEKDETHSVGNDRSKTITHNETSNVGNDQTETVGNNRTKTVGNNEQTSIGVNRSEQVGANESIKIGANRTEAVGANETIAIAAHRTITVGATETATVALARFHNVGLNEMINIGAAQEVNVGAAQTITVGAVQMTSVGAAQSTDVAFHRSVTAGSQSHEVGSTRTATVGGSDTLSVRTELTINAGSSVTIKVGETGGASITMSSDGTININGKHINVTGTGHINFKASGDVNIKGKTVKHNS
jgi:type VI secretion system secreted protein VgrG